MGDHSKKIPQRPELPIGYEVLFHPNDAKELWWKEPIHFNNLRRDMIRSMNKGKKSKKGSVFVLNKTIMVGDQLGIDIGFGNKAGMGTIKVTPFDEKNEAFELKALRFFENELMKK
jgi:hypothetical protein